MTKPIDWLEHELSRETGKPRKPPTLKQTIKLAGGKAKLARSMAGIPSKGKLPAKGTAERKRYNSQMRAIQRAEKAAKKEAGQTRPGRKIAEIGKELRREKELLRRRSVTFSNVLAMTSINGQREPNYMRERPLDTVSIGAGTLKAILAARNEGDRREADRLLSEALEPGVFGKKVSGVASIEITDIEYGDVRGSDDEPD